MVRFLCTYWVLIAVVFRKTPYLNIESRLGFRRYGVVFVKTGSRSLSKNKLPHLWYLYCRRRQFQRFSRMLFEFQRFSRMLFDFQRFSRMRLLFQRFSRMLFDFRRFSRMLFDFQSFSRMLFDFQRFFRNTF